jgi:hypothetical protein
MVPVAAAAAVVQPIQLSPLFVRLPTIVAVARDCFIQVALFVCDFLLAVPPTICAGCRGPAERNESAQRDSEYSALAERESDHGDLPGSLETRRVVPNEWLPE